MHGEGVGEMKIQTKRLTLRPVQPGDETEIHEYASDKDITMMFWLPNETFEETADFVKRNTEEWGSPDQTDFEFVILLARDLLNSKALLLDPLMEEESLPNNKIKINKLPASMMIVGPH